MCSTKGPGVKPVAGDARRWTTRVLRWGRQEAEGERRKPPYFHRLNSLLEIGESLWHPPVTHYRREKP